MYAVGMIRGNTGVHSFEVPMPEIRQPDEVLVRVKEVGLDGTDFGIVRQGVPDMPKDRDRMVLGHEMVGVVEAVGSEVSSLVVGDRVALTVRRGCGICHPCLHNQSDMCMTGLFKERGIHKLDGYLTHYVVDQDQYIVRIPQELTSLAVFTEPLSIAEKAIEQIRIIQSRLPWACSHPEHSFLSEKWGGCKNALVVGAGPLGLLTAALITLAEANTFVVDIVPEDSPKARFVTDIGAGYVNARTRTPEEIVDSCLAGSSNLNLIVEASGAAETAMRLIPHMSRSSIYVMTGIPRGEMRMQIDAAEVVRQIVRFNQVLVGSVNSNRTHFESALNDMSRIDIHYHGLLGRMITHRFALEDYAQAFDMSAQDRIKTVVEIDPWT